MDEKKVLLRSEISTIIREELLYSLEDQDRVKVFLLAMITLEDEEFTASNIEDFCKPLIKLDVLNEESKKSFQKILDLVEEDAKKEQELNKPVKKKPTFSFNFDR